MKLKKTINYELIKNNKKLLAVRPLQCYITNISSIVNKDILKALQDVTATNK